MFFSLRFLSIKILTMTLSVALTFPIAAETSLDEQTLSADKRSRLFEILQQIGKKYQEQKPKKNINNQTTQSKFAKKNSIVLPPSKTPQIELQTDLADLAVDAYGYKTSPVTGIPEGQDLILSLYIDKLYLADVFAYKSRTGAKISLGSFFKIVDFPIQIDFTQKLAKGWFINESNQFLLDFSETALKNKHIQVTINGQTSFIQSSDFIIEENEVYVDGDLLSRWFDLNLSYNFTDLLVKLLPSHALPIQLRLARENRAVITNNKSVSVMPWKESNYQMLSSPMVDVQLQTSTDNNNNNFSSYSMLGSHDLAYMNADYFIAGDTNKELKNTRIKFSKYSETGKIFGFLPATNFEIGDIRPVSIGTTYNSNINRGVLLSNNATNKTDNNRININGDIQPDWDVELYRNDILIDKQTSVQKGRYEFNDIDLLFGENDFEMILYGPQGQVEKEYKTVYVDKNVLSNSESSYGLSISQLGKSLLGIDNFAQTGTEGILVSGAYNQGITDWFSISLGQSTLFSDESDNEYNYNAGVNLTAFERLLLHSDINVNQRNEHNILFTAKTSIANHSLFYSFQENNIKKRSQLLKMNGSLLFNSGSSRINYANQLQYRDDAFGNSTKSFFNQLSYVAGRYSVQHGLRWQQQQNQIGSNDFLQGSLQVQGTIGPVFTRFSSSYTIKPTSELTNISTQLSWQLLHKVQSNIRIDYVPKSEKYNVNLGINWQHDAFNLSTYYNYNDDKNWSLGLFVRFGFGYDIDNNRSFMSPTGLTSTGSVNARVFEDENINGIYDDGENLIEGAKIKAVQVLRQGVSDEDGFALIKGMPTNIITDIILQQNTLGDPFLIPATKGVAITPRKGFLQTIDYPVVTSGEIDGSVYVTHKNGIENILPYATMQLRNEEGELVDTTDTEFDGYYLFVDLIPGKYTVSIADDYIQKNKLQSSEGLRVNLTTQGDVINGSDISLAQLNFTSGYVVNIGTFNNLKILKVYWNLIQRRYRSKLKQTVFYVENDITHTNMLNLGFYKEKQDANIACETVTKADIKCNVLPYEFVIKKNDM
ncbi:MAG: hypothetical protein ACJAS1_004547 [Oleiphilaceae bacterium]|jgi:hypothetical protein